MSTLFLPMLNKIHYLEYCNVEADAGALTFNQSQSGKRFEATLPYKTFGLLCLGPGTTLSQGAAEILNKGRVDVMFTNGGGFPVLLHSTYYQPNHYAQAYIREWTQDRVGLSKSFFLGRIELTKNLLKTSIPLYKDSFKRIFNIDAAKAVVFSSTSKSIDNLATIDSLLGLEGDYVLQLIRLYKESLGLDGSEHIKAGGCTDFGRRIQYGNYLAYGVANRVANLLGLPKQFPLSHGLTRRNGLVFDIADQIKDGLLLPLSIYSFKRDLKDREFRAECIEILNQLDVVNLLCKSIASILKEDPKDDDFLPPEAIDTSDLDLQAGCENNEL